MNGYTDADIEFLTQYNFAEAGNQTPEGWVANTYVALNRLKSGEYGAILSDVVRDMSAAIKTNSKQWQLASGQTPMNEYEQNVFKKIYAIVSGVLRGDIPNPVGEATHFENIEKFGKPNWVKGMKKIIKIGDHTYYIPQKKKKKEKQPSDTQSGVNDTGG